MLCKHIQCRKRQDRQDLQCQREENHVGQKHLHTVALGFCELENPMFSNLHGHKKPFDIRCHICKLPDWAEYSEPTKSEMLEQNICFGCHFWLRLIPFADTSVRINGMHFMIQPDGTHYPGGFGGREFRIKFKDGREVVTHNLWEQGIIPVYFRKQLPDNADFI